MLLGVDVSKKKPVEKMSPEEQAQFEKNLREAVELFKRKKEGK